MGSSALGSRGEACVSQADSFNEVMLNSGDMRSHAGAWEREKIPSM